MNSSNFLLLLLLPLLLLLFSVAIQIEGDSTNVNAKSKPILLFLLGVEGSGHHLIADILQAIPSTMAERSFKVFVPLSKLYLTSVRQNEELRSQRLQWLIKEIEELHENYDNGNEKEKEKLFLLDGYMLSFPYKWGEDVLIRPDLIELYPIFSIYFRLRFLVLIRNPKDCIASLIRRDEEGDRRTFMRQAYIVEDGMNQITQQLKSLNGSKHCCEDLNLNLEIDMQCVCVRSIFFNEMTNYLYNWNTTNDGDDDDDDLGLSNKLGQLLEIDSSIIKDIMVKKKHNFMETNEKLNEYEFEGVIKEFLDLFFTPSRIFQWQSLNDYS